MYSCSPAEDKHPGKFQDRPRGRVSRSFAGMAAVAAEVAARSRTATLALKFYV